MMTPYFVNSKTIDEIRKDHEKRMQNIGGDFHLINNLGSMITEKSSRDWIMRSEPHRVQPVTIEEDKYTHKSNTDVAPQTQEAAPTTPTATPTASTPTPQPEAKAHLEPIQTISVTPPETIRQLEQQQATISRLENEVAFNHEQLKRDKLESEARIVEERRYADAARQTQIKKIEELQNSGVISAVSPPARATSQAFPENNPLNVASLRTISVTTDREQALYRNAVTAYKIGDCAISMKAFDNFSKEYPSSPFSNDVIYYRKDCADRLAATGRL